MEFRVPETYKHLIYLGTAGALGLCWYAALLLTELSAILLASRVGAIAALCLLAVVLAATWRKPIIHSGTAEQAAGLALGLPLLGATIFALGLIVAGWLFSGDLPTSVTGVFRTLLLLIIGTPLVVALLSFYVIIPMGAISLWLLRRLGQRLWLETHH